MPMIPPPPPISEELFIKRIAEGKRGMKKIDPRFYEWLENNRKFYSFAILLVAIIGAVGLGFVLFVIIYNGLQR